MGRRGGGGKLFPDFGRILNPPFHSEHLKYTQVWGYDPLLPFPTNPGGNGGKGISLPRFPGAPKILRALLGPKSWFVLIGHRRCGLGGPEGGGGDT